MEELIKLYKEYFQLLRDEIIELSSIAAVHGWSSKRVEQGKALRQKIIELENNIFNNELSWFDKWYELFPKGVKSGSKLVRSDYKTCKAKMEKFVKTNAFSASTILKATKDYVDEFSNNGYKYMKCATYFINKHDQGSELAARCQALLDGNNKPVYKQIKTDLV